jgi:hypothetical protein
MPVYHVYPPPPVSAELERSASPPAVFPQGGSPPLPTGFISVPLQPVRAPPSDPGSPTARPMYGASPPHPHHHMPYGSSPPHPHIYGTSPPGMPGSPPGMLYMPPGPGPFVPHHHPGSNGPEGYGMHAAYGMHAQQQQQQQADFVQHMAGMSLSQQQQGVLPQQQQQQAMRPGSSGSTAGASGGRSEGRASARIARSHRAGGAYNPAEFAFDLEEAASGRPDARCTVMIRNIPNKYNQAQMLSILEKSGFTGCFDFFYLPIDFRNRCNLGYCFVNFLDAPDAGRLYRKYHNQRWEEFNSKKVCEVTYARVQGRDSLVQHFRASKFPSDDATELMPLVYNTDSGRAANPLPIHAYLAEVEGVDGSQQGPGSAAGGSHEEEAEE